jgi:DNA-binding LacI/PurR family transcriptional regulator
MTGDAGRRVKISQRVTLADLAAHLKLSKSTDSRVLSQVPAVRSIPLETQQRVIDAARRFNYEANLLARFLQLGKTLNVGVVLPCLTEAYSAQILGGVQDGLGKASYTCVVFQHHRDPSTLDGLEATTRQRNVDGLISISTALTWVPLIPMVTVSWPGKLPLAYNLQLDHVRVARLGLKHLVSKGHRFIALIEGQNESSDAQSRARAIRQEASSLGIDIPDVLVEKLRDAEPLIEPGYAATKRLLASGLTLSAIFAFNDYTAIGSIKSLREAGLRVPKDVSVIGVDNVQPAGYHDPALTTLAQPLPGMGRKAAGLLLELLARRVCLNQPQTVLVRPTLIERASTAHVAQPVDWNVDP